MNKLIISTAAVAALVSSVSAQSLVAGWDFSQSPAAGAFLNADADALIQSVPANYTDGAADFSGAASKGTMYWDGTNGSDNIVTTAPGVGLFPNTGTDIVDNVGGVLLGSGANLSLLSQQGQTHTNSMGMDLNDIGSSTFTIAVSADTVSSDWEVVFSSFLTGDTGATINVAWSDDGSNFVGSQAVAIAATEDQYVVDFSGAGSHQDIWFSFDIAGYTGSQFAFDSLGATATPIPEPAALGGLFGLAALLIARRRA